LGDYPRTPSISYLLSLISRIEKYEDMGKFLRRGRGSSG
jgi:HEPN domain-containing protein